MNSEWHRIFEDFSPRNNSDAKIDSGEIKRYKNL